MNEDGTVGFCVTRQIFLPCGIFNDFAVFFEDLDFVAVVRRKVVVKSLAHDAVYKQCRPLVIGDVRRLERANELVGGKATVRRIKDATEARYEPGVIDCIGLVICPGFIDLHSHSDYPLLEEATRGNVNFLTQGVSTVVTGNCGAGPIDVADYYTKLDGKVGTRVGLQPPGVFQPDR